MNHGKHNTDFFYALLVARKTHNPDCRYDVKHYVLFRGDDEIHEIDESQIRIADSPYPRRGDNEAVFAGPTPHHQTHRSDANPERVKIKSSSPTSIRVSAPRSPKAWGHSIGKASFL